MPNSNGPSQLDLIENQPERLRICTMSDYDSGDELLADINAESIVAGTKRDRSESAREVQLSKRPKVEDADFGSTGSNSNDEFVEHIAKTTLKENFGFDQFRHEQFSAIKSILRGENALVVFPTGAGKSLCYQVESSIAPNNPQTLVH